MADELKNKDDSAEINEDAIGPTSFTSSPQNSGGPYF